MYYEETFKAFLINFFQVNALDLAPNYAGSLTAMINGTSTISGIITPYLIGLLTPDVSSFGTYHSLYPLSVWILLCGHRLPSYHDYTLWCWCRTMQQYVCQSIHFVLALSNLQICLPTRAIIENPFFIPFVYHFYKIGP